MATLYLVTELERLTALVPAWRALATAQRASTVFDAPEWNLFWMEAHADRERPFCFVYFEGERLLGILPLTLQRVRGAHVLRFPAIPWNDVRRVLVEPQYAAEFAGAVANTLADMDAQWDVLYLSELAEDAVFLREACVRGLRGRKCVALDAEPLPSIPLPSRAEDYSAMLSGARRKKLRAYRSRLAQAGEISFRVIVDAARLEPELYTFFRVRQVNWEKRGRWSRMTPAQKEARFVPEFVRMCRELAHSGQVCLMCLELNRKPIAWDLMFLVNDTMSDYMTTYDLEYAAYSPGQLVLLDGIHYSIGRGCTRMDLGRGDQSYKVWFGGIPSPVQNVMFYSRHPRSLAFVSETMIRQTVRRWLRGTTAQKNVGRNGDLK